MSGARKDRLGWWAGAAGLAAVVFAAVWGMTGQVHRDVNNITMDWTSVLQYALVVGAWFLFLAAVVLIGSPDAEAWT